MGICLVPAYTAWTHKITYKEKFEELRIAINTYTVNTDDF